MVLKVNGNEYTTERYTVPDCQAVGRNAVFNYRTDILIL